MPAHVSEEVKQVSDVLSGHRRASVDSGKLLADIMERWGGTEKFARDVVFEFSSAKEGTIQRQKLMEMVQKLIITNSIHGMDRAERPEDLDDEEIQERLNYYIARVASSLAAKSDVDSTARRTFVPPEEREEDAPPDFG